MKKIIYDLIPEGSSVLDLGCGDGELLSKLMKNKKVFGLGVEKDIDQVAKAIEKGIPILQLDLDEGLAGLPDKFFDYVVLEKTLQAVFKPLLVLEEMLRVGGSGIVSFPNFSNWQVVSTLLFNGRMPITSGLPYQWHDTPNIHLLTANDFLDWARSHNVLVEKGYSRVNDVVVPFNEEDVFMAEDVLFVVSQK